MESKVEWRWTRRSIAHPPPLLERNELTSALLSNQITNELCSNLVNSVMARDAYSICAAMLPRVVLTNCRGLATQWKPTSLNQLATGASFSSFPRFAEGTLVDPFTKEKFPPQIENALKGRTKAARRPPPERILSDAKTAAHWSGQDQGKFFKCKLAKHKHVPTEGNYASGNSMLSV